MHFLLKWLYWSYYYYVTFFSLLAILVGLQLCSYFAIVYTNPSIVARKRKTRFRGATITVTAPKLNIIQGIVRATIHVCYTTVRISDCKFVRLYSNIPMRCCSWNRVGNWLSVTNFVIQQQQIPKEYRFVFHGVNLTLWIGPNSLRDSFTEWRNQYHHLVFRIKLWRWLLLNIGHSKMKLLTLLPLRDSSLLSYFALYTYDRCYCVKMVNHSFLKGNSDFERSPEHISTSKNLLPFNNVKFISFQAL